MRRGVSSKDCCAGVRFLQAVNVVACCAGRAPLSTARSRIDSSKEGEMQSRFLHSATKASDHSLKMRLSSVMAGGAQASDGVVRCCALKPGAGEGCECVWRTETVAGLVETDDLFPEGLLLGGVQQQARLCAVEHEARPEALGPLIPRLDVCELPGGEFRFTLAGVEDAAEFRWRRVRWAAPGESRCRDGGVCRDAGGKTLPIVLSKCSMKFRLGSS